MAKHEKPENDKGRDERTSDAFSEDIAKTEKDYGRELLKDQGTGKHREKK